MFRAYSATSCQFIDASQSIILAPIGIPSQLPLPHLGPVSNPTTSTRAKESAISGTPKQLMGGALGWDQMG